MPSPLFFEPSNRDPCGVCSRSACRPSDEVCKRSVRLATLCNTRWDTVLRRQKAGPRRACGDSRAHGSTSRHLVHERSFMYGANPSLGHIPDKGLRPSRRTATNSGERFTLA